MKSPEERRTPHVQRVSLAALVDICSQTGDGSPFQAESCNVSGRGMHVRTSFLPEIGDELVCRLNLDEEEILVEGRVAWRSEGEDSGEFGIQFTALDADSAHLLQKMGEPKKQVSSFQVLRSPRAPEVDDELEDEDSQVLAAGSRVRLHIEGLGAPMKACVHEGTQRKVRVGSSLEFLKVGRSLQLEDLNGGISRGAQVDSVNVVINPATSIPELVVQLRYEGVTPTPPPAELEERSFDEEAFGPSSARQLKSAAQRGAQGRDSQPQAGARKLSSAPERHVEPEGDEFDDEEVAAWEPAAEALRERLGGAMTSASQAAQRAGGLLGSLALSAKASVLARTARADEKKAPLRKTSHRAAFDAKMTSPETARRVQTSRRDSSHAPSHLRSGIHELGLAGKSTRPARNAESAPSAAAPARRKLGMPVLFGAAFLFLSGSAVVLRGMGSDEATGAAALEKAPLEEGQTAPPAATPAAPTAAAPAKPEAEASVMAEVPLFGPQAMAVKPAEPTPSREDAEQSEMRAAAASVDDQSWEEPTAETEVLESKPWGNGKLYLPTVHRIRLDGLAPSLSGAVNQDGFTIVIPGRKAMESGKAIQKRDKRIMAVQTNNNAGGATVKFEFRGPVPPYRVRLRKDFVEFLISAPEETVARL